MGRLVYSDYLKMDFEDRVLAHLQAVIHAKLRRGESFSFSWRDDVGIGGGRTSIWVNPSSSIVFKFYGSRQPEINRDWIDALMFTANSPGGLLVVPEPVG